MNISRQAEQLSPLLVRRLSEVFGPGALLTDPADCWTYGYDNSRHQALPQAVAFASNHAQVLAITQLANDFKIPLIARGRGTGTTGATVPITGGVVLSLERMDQIIQVDPANRFVKVQPGVTNQALQDALSKYGFFWAPDPSSAAVCTIGGNLAYNSAGPRAIKYGTPRENTLGLRAISGAGEDFTTGVVTSKGVVGLDLTRLLIGSEGTLAIITEATLKITPSPTHKRTLQAIYTDIHAAASAVSAIMAQPATPCALEFMDGTAIDMVRNYSDLGLPATAGALLLIEADGSEQAVAEAAEHITDAARQPGCLSVVTAASVEDVTRLWQTRRALSPALRTVAPKKINEDIAVPVSRIPDLIDGLEQLSNQHCIKIVNFGHAGNGNIHVNLLVDPDQPGQSDAAERCLDAVFDLVLNLDGTLSGEHGVGLEKRDFITRELDPVALRLMHGIKRQFDPLGVLNPEKSLPLT